MGWFSKLFGAESYQPGIGRKGIDRNWHRVGSGFLAVRHPTEPGYDLVGESRFQDNIAAIVGERYEGGVYWQALGQICFIEDNAVDPYAIGVLIDGKPVGWVPRSDNQELRRQIIASNPEQKPIVCKAMIHGGFRKSDGSWASYGVRIGLSDPLELFECGEPSD